MPFLALLTGGVLGRPLAGAMVVGLAGFLYWTFRTSRLEGGMPIEAEVPDAAPRSGWTHSVIDLGLVLVGMEDSQAEEVSGRLGPVANRHLDRELPVRATVRRIDVVEGSVRRMFDESDRVPKGGEKFFWRRVRSALCQPSP